MRVRRRLYASVMRAANLYTGKLIAAGTDDGTLQVWTMGGAKTRPHKTCRKAHGPGEITGVSIGPDGHTLASRSFDNTMKVWDLRKFTQPLKTFEGLENFISETDCLFSPNGRYIMTGTSVYTRDTKEIGPDGRTKIVKAADTGDQQGRLVFVDPVRVGTLLIAYLLPPDLLPFSVSISKCRAALDDSRHPAYDRVHVS